LLEEFSQWIKTIVMVLLFATFAELLLPNSRMQKFVRVILGLFIMLAIIGPVINIIALCHDGGNGATFAWSAAKYTDIAAKSRQSAEQSNRIAYERFRQEIARQIRAVTVALDGVSDAEVIVTLTAGEAAGAPSAFPTLRKVQSITILVRPSGEKMIKIVPVGGADGASGLPQLDAATAERIIRTISELYQVPRSQISVKRLN